MPEAMVICRWVAPRQGPHSKPRTWTRRLRRAWCRPA